MTTRQRSRTAAGSPKNSESPPPRGDDNGLRNAGLAILAVGVVLAGLIYGRTFLLPLAISILVWNLLEAMIDRFASISLGGFQLPRWLAAVLGIAVVLLGFYLVISIILGQIDAVMEAWPRYAERLRAIAGDLTQWLGSEQSAKVKAELAKIDVSGRLYGAFASAQSFVLTLLLVIAYVGFLFVESGYMVQKIVAMCPERRRADEARKVMMAVSESVRRYVSVKTGVSALTGVCCYLVLRWLGIDFAATWALLIFFLNFIPNIGSIIGVALPALVALVQFDTLGPFVILVVSLTTINLAIGSVLEPMLMGHTLNLSPFAILLSLAFWGMIWGIVGMFLSVPIMVLVMIICAHVPGWRWIAVLLSKDGQVEG
jgi:predicted PurR-regulated permease PerM